MMPHPEGLTLGHYTSDDASMRSCLALAKVAAPTDLPILILGESGTGKTLLARAIHNSSPRAHFPFVSFNAAALSETLLDSQLFGHERGAFTGATQRVKGKFELADRGTLFIDEIGDMSLAAQAKILRAVEYGEFERLGSESLRVAAVRLISATHLTPRRFMQPEYFRQDLFYRISGITLRVPPLRDRPNDLRSLIAAEIAGAAQAQSKKIVGLSRTAAERLLEYRWPGNLRERRRVIQSAVALTIGETVLPDAVHLDAAMGGFDTDAESAPAARASSRTPELSPTPSSEAGDLQLRTVELRHIHHVMALTHGNKRQAARLLGLSRSTLDRKLATEPLGTALEFANPARAVDALA
jgi:transcriptional regulator with PAS, ATPase and Fis domain